MCTNQLANCTCGFVGADPNLVVPDWRIIKRNSNGVVVSDEIISGLNIIRDTTDGLEWIPDLANPNNSVLRIGPVDGTDNQSSYQCTITTILSGTVVSEVGALTVLGEMRIHQCTCHIIAAHFDCMNPTHLHLVLYIYIYIYIYSVYIYIYIYSSYIVYLFNCMDFYLVKS